MRTLFEIVEGAKDGAMPTHEECYWAMLAMDGLRHFDHMAVMKLCSKEKTGRVLDFMRSTYYEESFRRTKLAVAKSPKDWLGPSNDPSNPEYQKMRRAAFAIARAATGIDFQEPNNGQ